MKKCTQCKKVKPLSDFSKRRAAPDGLDYACRACSSERQRLIRASGKKKQNKPRIGGEMQYKAFCAIFRFEYEKTHDQHQSFATAIATTMDGAKYNTELAKVWEKEYKEWNNWGGIGA